MAAKQNTGTNSQPVAGLPGMAAPAQEVNENDPVAVLEKHSCSVFLPNT